MEYRYDCYSDIGGRENNEDCFCTEVSDGAYLFAVADGLGGHDCGENASSTAIDILREHFNANPKSFSIKNAFTDANASILKKQSDLHNNMKTTLAAVHICDGKATIANVGDSRAYLLKNDRIVFQTIDHSVAQMAVLVGEITAGRIRYHEDRNILTRALGINSELKIDVTEFPETEFDSLLLCSDGFWEYVLESEMISASCCTDNPMDLLDSMRKILKKRVSKSNDNNTAIAVFQVG